MAFLSKQTGSIYLLLDTGKHFGKTSANGEVAAKEERGQQPNPALLPGGEMQGNCVVFE